MERLYKCTQQGCDFTSNHGGYFTVHHAREKPYKCSHEECDYACTSSYVLTKHIYSFHVYGSSISD